MASAAAAAVCGAVHKPVIVQQSSGRLACTVVSSQSMKVQCLAAAKQQLYITGCAAPEGQADNTVVVCSVVV